MTKTTKISIHSIPQRELTMATAIRNWNVLMCTITNYAAKSIYQGLWILFQTILSNISIILKFLFLYVANNDFKMIETNSVIFRCSFIFVVDVTYASITRGGLSRIAPIAYALTILFCIFHICYSIQHP